jgi:unsaturated chondroitin disaccharide hydrolase
VAAENASVDLYHRAFDFAAGQVRRLVERHPDCFPMYTVDGRWVHEGERWTNWCEGLLGGQLWLIYERTRDQWWREKAEDYCRLMEHRKSDRETHDLGFLFWPTWKRWYDLTGDAAKNEVVVEAGRTLALRYRERPGYICSFIGPESLFIDIMMNVPIILYAGRETGDADLTRRATRHCLTTRRFLVRGDGSTAHEGIFDPESGAFLRHSTHQGWRPDSCWSRGQAWALYGFARVYRMTDDRRFLDAARRCARYYLERAPENGVPPNDLDEPEPDHEWESSAAAIAAGGLWDLAEMVDETAEAADYRAAARRTLRTLCRPPFLAEDDPRWEGVLKHGIYHLPKGLGVDESVMWGDYFFLEALSKVMPDER